MIKLRLNEQQFLRTVRLITENRESQAKERSLQVIRDYFRRVMPYWNVDDIFRHPDNPDELSNLNYMFKCFEEVFFHDPKLRSSQIIRLEPAFVKMAFDAGFQQGHNDAKKLNRIRLIIWRMYHVAKSSEKEAKLITKIPLDVTFEQLNDKYGVQIDNENAAESERIDNTQYTENGEYKIVGPVTFNTANKYAQYTGDMENDSTKMCYGMFHSTWEDYTNDDNYNVYLVLKNGWKDLEPVHDDDSKSGYDTYGLSMIWVIVDDEGDLAYCNTRWNHLARYKAGRSVDNALSREEISNIIGKNFFKAFGVEI
jgi:hypothetical protein